MDRSGHGKLSQTGAEFDAGGGGSTPFFTVWSNSYIHRGEVCHETRYNFSVYIISTSLYCIRIVILSIGLSLDERDPTQMEASNHFYLL